MKCYCGKDWEGTSATPYLEGYFDKQGNLIGGVCLHGEKFGISFDEYIKYLQFKKEDKSANTRIR